MKFILMVLLVMVSTRAWAECTVREYSQIREMDVAQLEKEAEDANRFISLYKSFDYSRSTGRKWEICEKELEKIEQVLKSKRTSEKAVKQEQINSQRQDSPQPQENTQRNNPEIYRSTDSNGTMVFTDNPMTVEEMPKPKKTKKNRY